MVNQTVSVCTKTMAGEFGDEEPNLENDFKWLEQFYPYFRKDTDGKRKPS